MINIKVEKIKRKIRKMSYQHRIELMDWMNLWYVAMTEEDEE